MLNQFINDRAFVIAEIGNNHDGSKEKALQLIDIAADCGADAVKFQTFRGLDIVSPRVKTTEYPQWNIRDYKYWYQFLDSIALPLSDHLSVFAYAKSRGLNVFSTPTSPDIVEFLESIDVSAYKIASMDITNLPLLKRVAATGKPVIVSTGMSNDYEINQAMSIFSENEVALLHCISDYPLNLQDANLLAINHLKREYPQAKAIGFSDHSLDSFLSCLAVAMGSKIIEKHITYDRSSPSPAEHHFSLDPDMFRDFISDIRKTESTLGSQSLVRSTSEKTNITKYRRSIHINKSLSAGAILRAEDLAVVRPGVGAPPEYFDQLIGSSLLVNKDAWDPLLVSEVASTEI